MQSAPSIPKPGDKVRTASTEKIDSEKTKDKIEVEEADYKSTEAPKEFNEEALKSIILEFIKNNKVGPLVENSLKNSMKVEGDMITVELTNPVEVDGIEKIKADFLNFVRNRFHKRSIQLQHKVNIEKAAERPYTPKEKFEAMLKENPLLGKLKDTFGLDTDY